VLAVDLDKELVIVDDGSTDGTRELLREKIESLPGVRVFYHPENQGKGAAIRTGKEHLTGEIALIQDDDLEYDPNDLPQVDRADRPEKSRRGLRQPLSGRAALFFIGTTWAIVF
jgi:glycosyltransferase involved in cell wall biosynthesis